MRGMAPVDYGVSKAAIAHMARIAGREVERLGSREAAMMELGRASSPFGRLASADEIAGQIGFLLSNMAALITGTVLVSDGGYSI